MLQIVIRTILCLTVGLGVHCHARGNFDTSDKRTGYSLVYGLLWACCSSAHHVTCYSEVSGSIKYDSIFHKCVYSLIVYKSTSITAVSVPFKQKKSSWLDDGEPDNPI